MRSSSSKPAKSSSTVKPVISPSTVKPVKSQSLKGVRLKAKQTKQIEAPRTLCEELLDIVREIPEGRVTSYGYLGQLLSRPCSGLVVGKLLANPYADAPWWRVVGVDGTLLLRRRSPMLGEEQARLLEGEGIAWDEAGRVEMAQHRWERAGG